MVRTLFATEAGEGALVAGVDRGAGVLATATGTTTGTAELTTTGGTTATAASTIATGTTAGTTATATGGALRLDVAVLEFNELLDLALTLALGLAASTDNVVLALILDEGLGAGPLLVLLDSLVGLAEGEGGLVLKSELLLGLLGEVLVEGHVLLLLLLLLGVLIGSGILLLLSLGDRLTGLLVLKLSLAFGGTPSLSSSLLGVGYASLAVAVILGASAPASATTTATVPAARATGSLIGGLASVAVAAGIAITERSLVTACVSSAASAGRLSTSLDGRNAISVALGGVGRCLLDSLHRGGGTIITLDIVAEEIEEVLRGDRHLAAVIYRPSRREL